MTAKEAVFELLKRERERGETSKLDVDTTHREWLLALADLMSMFRKWLSSAEQETLLRIKEYTISIHEERLGTYDAPALDIVTPGGVVVSIRPKARIIVGGMGRIDFDAPSRSRILVRKDRTTWQFASLAADRGHWSFLDLDENSFWQTLNELIM